MAPWSEDDKRRLIELIAQHGRLSAPSDASLGVVKNWAQIADAFNQGKDEDDVEYRTKVSMQSVLHHHIPGGFIQAFVSDETLAWDRFFLLRSQWSRSAKLILDKTKDANLNFANNATHGEMLLQRYEYAFGIKENHSAGSGPATAPQSLPRPLHGEDGDPQIDHSVKEQLERIAQELVDVLATLDDKAARDCAIDFFNGIFHH